MPESHLYFRAVRLLLFQLFFSAAVFLAEAFFTAVFFAAAAFLGAAAFLTLGLLLAVIAGSLKVGARRISTGSFGFFGDSFNHSFFRDFLFHRNAHDRRRCLGMLLR